MYTPGIKDSLSVKLIAIQKIAKFTGASGCTYFGWKKGLVDAPWFEP
jgi:hypothetical protein